MSWFSTALDKAYYIGRRTVEVLNLKTERSLKKDNAASLNNDELVAKNSSTRRSVASSVLGIMINIGLSVACPPFAAAAAVNAWQLGVSATNSHRVKREVKKRMHNNKNFKAMYKECNKPVRDIVVGCSIKAGFAALSMGIVGFDHIADGFEHIAHHASTAATQCAMNGAGDVVAYSSTMSGDVHAQNVANAPHYLGSGEHVNSGGNETELDREAVFKLEHPHMAQVDKAVHKPFSLGDQFAKIVGQTIAGRIETDIGWDKLGDMLENGVSRAELFFKVVSIGVFAEIVQPIAVVVEQQVNKWYQKRDESRAKEFVRLKQDISAEMKTEQRDAQAGKEFALRNELEQVLKRRVRAETGVA